MFSIQVTTHLVRQLLHSIYMLVLILVVNNQASSLLIEELGEYLLRKIHMVQVLSKVHFLKSSKVH